MVKRDDTLVLRTVSAEVGRVLQSPTPVEEKLALLADYVSDAFGETPHPPLYQWRDGVAASRARLMLPL